MLCFAMTVCLLNVTMTESHAKQAKVDKSIENIDVDFGARIRALEKDESYKAEMEARIQELGKELPNGGVVEATEEAGESNFTFNGGTKYFLAYDIVNSYYFKTFTLRRIGENVEVWVADDIAFHEDNREVPIVTQEQVDRLAKEFDETIYPIDTDFFGKPATRTGANAYLSNDGTVPENYFMSKDGKDRVILLVDNVRDENYYDEEYPFYTAGFFTSSFGIYMDRNIVTVDTNDWANRLESLFGTTTHELQHLIHSDNDGDEDTWLNEGMSDFAIYLNGYGHPMGHVNYFLQHPENSLVAWDEFYSEPTGPETLADYGQAYLLMLYLYDHYGKEFVRKLSLDPGNGIGSLDQLLKSTPDPLRGEKISFNELFRRFTIACLVDDPNLTYRGYNYYFKSIDVKVDTKAALNFDKEGVPAWGADYKKLDTTRNIVRYELDGSKYTNIPWEVVEDSDDATNKVLYAGSGALYDSLAVLSVNLKEATEATLTFDQKYDIEQDWDYAFIQVSTDGGDTWTSLENENMVDTFSSQGHPAIKAQLPGFTGNKMEWSTETIDLSEYAGQEILLGFRYMTDWGTEGQGWFVDNIKIEEAGIDIDGTTLSDFRSIHQIQGNEVEFGVVFVTYNENDPWNYPGNPPPRISTIEAPISRSLQRVFKKSTPDDDIYMIVWYAAPEGVTDSVNFTYRIVYEGDE